MKNTNKLTAPDLISIGVSAVYFVQKFGGISVMGIVMGLFFMTSGHFMWTELPV